MKKSKTKQPRGCEFCEHYDYNEDTEQYECRVALDEDEMINFLTENTRDCKYFNFYDEYAVVRKQN